MSRNNKERPGKPEIRWDYVGAGAWFYDEQAFRKKQETFKEEYVEELTKKHKEHYEEGLKKICPSSEFKAAVERVTSRYICRAKPKPPLSDRAARYQKAFQKRYIQPTLADMKKTFLDLQKTDNKVKQLKKISKAQPIWGVMKRAWYKEHKV